MSDLAQGFKDASSTIESIKTFKDVSSSEKSLKKSAGNSASKATSFLATQLDKISEQQKRFQRNAPDSMDGLLNLLGQTNGTGSESLKYLRKKLLETAVKIEPELQKILGEQAIKAIGCSQEQTYKGISSKDLQLQPLPLQPVSQGIYIPVNSLDFFSNLKNSPDSKVGKVYYEKPEPSVDIKFKPYGGKEPYPMNKQLFQRMDSQNLGKSYYTEYGKNYQGSSQQDLFDIQYTNTNEFGVSGDYYRVMLIDREGNTTQGATQGLTVNKVGEFLSDYYSTIKLIEPVDIGAQLVNILSGAINIKANLGSEDITNQSKFYLIVQRILGLCFDSRREIDISGISKIAELDGVDESFFQFNEVDLRNIDLRTTNVQNGVMEFVDCDNVKLPVNYDILVNELIEFRNIQSGQTTEQQVASIEKIVDTISQNPEWKAFLPSNFNVDISINKNVLKQLPLAIAAGVLTPKVLLPIFTLLSVVETNAKNTYNTSISSINSNIQSTNTTLTSVNNVSGQVNNVVNNGVDFVQKFKTFNIGVVSKISALFLKTLFDLLKKDIINLLSSVIGDISKSSRLKKYAMILRLVQIALVVTQLISDYRKCKSLLDNILLLLKLINGIPGSGISNTIPAPLLLLTKLLPGTSPERSTINTIKELQGLGIPTGTLPDGSPNLMLLYNLATHKGADKENAENGKIQAVGLVPPVVGGLVQIFGKAT